MDLAQVIYSMCQKSMNSAHLADIVIGTVVSADPLEISICSDMAPLKKSVLHLTESVIEKKIPIVTHSHKISDTYTGGGSCSTELSNIICYENGVGLPVEDGYIILNRSLQIGDKVLMLQASGGQSYVVLSRLF